MGVIWLPNPSRILCFSFHIILILLQQTTAARELKFVVVVFRHGDRTPIVNFPTDLHKESEWPQGFGQLTKTGMQQLFELGQYMRKRYSSFLNSTYNRQEFYIQSTDYDRTIMSAQSYLSGLFPPTSSQIWNPELLWQPIPVHIFQKSTEQRLNFPLPNCPRFDELQQETQTSKEFQNRIQPYMDFLQTMAVNTGLELNHLKILDNFQLWNTYDTLHCEGIHNYTLPVWATKDVIDKMEKLAELSLLSLFGVYKTEEKSRLQGGVLVNIILNSIKQAVNSSKPRKMEVYSAHDTTVGALQIALNIFNGKLPPYAACQFFELYQESNGQYSIEMHYRNDTSKDPYLLTLPGCTSSCPLEKFAELVSPVITENWSKECGKKDKMKGSVTVLYFPHKTLADILSMAPNFVPFTQSIDFPLSVGQIYYGQGMSVEIKLAYSQKELLKAMAKTRSPPVENAYEKYGCGCYTSVLCMLDTSDFLQMQSKHGFQMHDIFIGFNVAVCLLSVFNLVLLYLLYHYGHCRRRNNYQDI